MPTMSIFRNEPSVTFAAGESIVRSGEIGGVMYAVLEGSVSLIVAGKIVETVTEGGIFGEMALIDHAERSADAEAVTDVRLVSIDEKRFLYLVSNTPFFALEVMRVLADRLRRMDRLAFNGQTRPGESS